MLGLPVRLLYECVWLDEAYSECVWLDEAYPLCAWPTGEYTP